MVAKKLYTPAQANAALPLVRRIVQDIVDLAHTLRDRHQLLGQLCEGPAIGDAYHEEVLALEQELLHGQERMEELVGELAALGVELKDFFMGLVDFRCLMNGREVYLCWKLGEDEVTHWHELDAGFRGRQKLFVGSSVQ